MYIFGRLAKIGLEISPYYLVQEGLSDESVLKLKPELDPCQPGFLEPSDMKAISSISDGPSGMIPEDKLMGRLANGCKCFGIKHNGEIAAYMWCSLRECTDKSLSFKLKNDESYLFDACTVKAYRGKNLAPYLRYQLYRYLAEIGRTRCYSITTLFNSSSVRFKEKLKARNLRLYLYINLFDKLQWNLLLRDYERRN